MKFIKILYFTICISASHSIFAQGCSDAGFCTIESFKTHEPIDTNITHANTISFGTTYGQGQHQIQIINPYLEYTVQLDSKVSSTIKITTALHSGKVITKYRASDIIFSVNYKSSKPVILVGGLKLPFSSGNEGVDRAILPMAYQASLGTFDLIFGAQFRIKNIAITTAIQQPLIQNKNQFDFTNSTIDNLDGSFANTNNYKRSADVLIRLSHALKIKENTFTLSALPIYHLQNDTFLNNKGVQQEIEGSQGLTLNTNIFYTHKISNNKALEFSMGGPVISRKSRPDGLSQFSIGLEFTQTL